MVTPHESYEKLASALQMKSIVFKREDLHPYGSHKGRSIPIMIDNYILEGSRYFGISSSGNAALAAALHIEKLNKTRNDKVSLDILVGQFIPKKKLEKLEKFKNEYITVTMHDRPLQTLFRIAKEKNIRPLRQSNDDSALIGYHDLAEELLEIPGLSAVFIGTSSGTTAEALAQHFIENEKEVEIHIVQTLSCHPISSKFVDTDPTDEKSIADAIVDHTAFRKDKLIEIINKCGGSGWITSNEQIRSAQEITKINTGLEISTNSALSVAGLMQAVYTGKTWTGPVVCMICGD